MLRGISEKSATALPLIYRSAGSGESGFAPTRRGGTRIGELRR